MQYLFNQFSSGQSDTNQNSINQKKDDSSQYSNNQKTLETPLLSSDNKDISEQIEIESKENPLLNQFDYYRQSTHQFGSIENVLFSKQQTVPREEIHQIYLSWYRFCLFYQKTNKVLAPLLQKQRNLSPISDNVINEMLYHLWQVIIVFSTPDNFPEKYISQFYLYKNKVEYKQKLPMRIKLLKEKILPDSIDVPNKKNINYEGIYYKEGSYFFKKNIVDTVPSIKEVEELITLIFIY